MVEENGKDTTEEEPKERTWRDSLDDITEIAEACLEKADTLLEDFMGKSKTEKPLHNFVSLDTTVRFAESIFSAVVTAEVGRRRAQMQQGQSITIPVLGQPGQGGQYITLPGVTGGKSG